VAKIRRRERILVLEEESDGDVVTAREQLTQSDQVVGVWMREYHDVERAGR
jgi:hypothetical protein